MFSNDIVGAGYPDVSALAANIFEIAGNYSNAISGTSVAASNLAGIVNLCASQLPDEKNGFGWINSIIYKAEDLFFHIDSGNNQYGLNRDDEQTFFCEVSSSSSYLLISSIFSCSLRPLL